MEIKEINSTNLKKYRHLSYRGYPTNRDFSLEGINKFENDMREALEDENQFRTFAAFENDEMVGIMYSIDFQMNIYNEMTEVSGLGTLAVDPFYKRKGIGRKMVDYFEEEAKIRGNTTALLLPFRPDYYVNKGYGFLTKLDLYQVETQYFPKYTGNLNVRPLTDINDVFALHQELTEKNHGMIELTLLEKTGLKDAFADYSNVHVGIYNGNNLVGYTSYTIEPDVKGNYTLNYIKAADLMFKNQDALYALLGHFKGQQDQANYVEFFTQFKGFEQIFTNPLDQSGDFIGFGYLKTNSQSIGLMGKILDPVGWWEKHGKQFSLKYNLQWHVNDQKFGEGKTITIKTEHLAPLWFGTVPFDDLYRIGLIKCDTEVARELSHVFTGKIYPINHTDF